MKAGNGGGINFHGTAKSTFLGGTTIHLSGPLPAGNTVINFPYLPGDSSYWSNITWTDVTIDANGYADMCWDFEAPRDGFFARLGCRNAVGARAHWRIGGYLTKGADDDPAGLVPNDSNGTGFQTTVDDIFDIKDGATGPGANITVNLGPGGALGNGNYTIQQDRFNAYASLDRVSTRPVICQAPALLFSAQLSSLQALTPQKELA